MKKTPHFALKASAVALLLSLAPISFAEQLVDVNSFQLVGSIEALNESAQTKIATALESYQGKGKTIASLKAAQKALEDTLNGLGDRRYEVVLPPQEVENGIVVLEIKPRVAPVSRVIYEASRDFDKENIENSIPSLKEGRYYEDGRQWFDRREFNMTLENPLKVTRMHYELEPSTKSSTLSVLGFSPYGKHRGYVSVDNYGSREFEYARLTAGYVNANLTGRDDVLMINALTNFKKPGDSFAVGGSYSIPFYKYHQSVSVQLGYSNLDSKQTTSLPVGLNKKIVQGESYVAGFNWSYYLPQFDLGVQDQFKINAGYSYRYFKQNSHFNIYNRGYESESRYSIAGINLGISGEVQPTRESRISGDITYYRFGKGIWGTNNTEKPIKDYGFDDRYQLWTFRLGYSQDFAQGWNFDSQLSGQYSKDFVPPVDQYTVTGVYGVRGFRESGVNGAQSLVWRNELSTPKYGRAQVSGYVFYDMGHFKFNKDREGLKTSGTVSSAGVGFRTQVLPDLNTDIFVATRIHNADFDQKLNGEVMPKASLWAKISYSF